MRRLAPFLSGRLAFPTLPCSSVKCPYPLAIFPYVCYNKEDRGPRQKRFPDRKKQLQTIKRRCPYGTV